MPREPKKKNVMQDVVPPKRSIRNVELPSRKKVTHQVAVLSPDPVQDSTYSVPREVETESTAQAVHKHKTNTTAAATYKYEHVVPKKSKKKWLYASVLIFLLAVGFSISALFKSAEIKVTPKQQTKSLNNVFTAKVNAQSRSELGFQFVTVTKDVQKTVEATGEQKVERKATGTIVVYNNFSTTAQKLVINTRFQTPEGLLFFSLAPITIPGKKVVGGKTVAGSVEVRVQAEKSGTAYNVGLKDFTIPGFKGTSKYTTMYARSKTEMTGGFSGVEKTVAKEVVDAAETQLESELKDLLYKEFTLGIPANFVLYKDSLSYAFGGITKTTSGANAVLQKKGTVSGVIFDKASLSNAIFAKIAPDMLGDKGRIDNLALLDFSYATTTSIVGTANTSLTFTLKGDAHIISVFDENKLKSDLLGLSKAAGNTLISTYPAIDEAWIVTKPFWSRTIPNDPTKVTFINTASDRE